MDWTRLEIEWATLIGALCLLLPRALVFVRQRLPVGPLAENELKADAASGSKGKKRALSPLSIFQAIDEKVTKALDRLIRPFAVSPKTRRDEPRPTSGQFLSNWETWRRDWREKGVKSVCFAVFNFVRGAAGTLLLLRAIRSSAVPEDGQAAISVVAVQFGILSIGTLFQTIQYRKEIVFVSPTFYVSGVTIAWSGWEIGGFGVLVGFIFALAMRELWVLLPVMGLGLAISGYIAYGITWTLLANVGIFFVIIFLSILTGRRLTFYVAPR